MVNEVVTFMEDPEAWRAAHDVARSLGFDTAMDLVNHLMRNPDWMPTDISGATEQQFQIFLNMRERIQEWNPVAAEIGGWGILLGTGGWSDIFIKALLGREEEINSSDVAVAALETFGAYGFSEALKALKSVPVIGNMIAPYVDELLKIGPAIDKIMRGAPEEWTADEAAGILIQAYTRATEQGISLGEAIRYWGGDFTDEILEAASKHSDPIIRNLAYEGVKEIYEAAARVSPELAADATLQEAVKLAAREAAEAIPREAAPLITREAAEAVTREVADDVIEEIIETIPRTTIMDAENWLRTAGYSDDFIKRFLSVFDSKSVHLGTSQAIDEAFKLVSKEVPSAGITPQVIKNINFMHPTLSKVAKYALGGSGIGVGYLGIQGVRQAAFAGFMFEEAEQQTMFAQFFTADDIQALARTIANVSLPIWDQAENWANAIGEPISGGAETLLGEFGKGMTTGPALGTHYAFTLTLIDKITNLEEMGAWTGLEYTGDLTDPITLEVQSWGRPTDSGELSDFLATNPQYYSKYERELQKLAQENPAMLYQLYYEGYTDWYELPGWMRDQITRYQEDLKNWEYQASRGELTGQDALDMAEAIAGTIWYDQADKTILQDAINAGNLVYTMMVQGKISEAKASTFLNGLEAKLKNNNHTTGLLNLDAGGKIQWKSLSQAEMSQKYGSLTTLAEKPELVFRPPGSTLASEAFTPHTSGIRTEAPERVTMAQEGVKTETGIDLARTRVTPSPENIRELRTLVQEYTDKFTEQFGVTPEQVTEARESLRLHEELAERNRLYSDIIRGTVSPAQVTEEQGRELVQAGFLTEDQWRGFKETGQVQIIRPYVGPPVTALAARRREPTAPGVPVTPTPTVPTVTPTGLDPVQIGSQLSWLEYTGVITEAEAQTAFEQAMGPPGPTGYFEMPPEGYDMGTLYAMQQFGTPTERATASQQLTTEWQREKAKIKRGGLRGYETGMPPALAPEAAEAAVERLGEEAEARGLTPEDIGEIEGVIGRGVERPSEVLFAGLEGEIEEAAMETLGYRPIYRDGVFAGYAGGRRREV